MDVTEQRLIEFANRMAGVISAASAETLSDTASKENRLKFEMIKLITGEGSKDGVLDLLHDVRNSAPISFDLRWIVVERAFLQANVHTETAIGQFALMIAWAYIETAWYAQRDGRQSFSLNGPPFARLAALALGLDGALDGNGFSESGTLVAIFTHGTLFNDFLLKRYEEGVKQGLDQVTSIASQLDVLKIQLSDADRRAVEATEKIASYEGTLEKYQVAFGFLGMSAAYKSFFERKKGERNLWAFGLMCLFVIVVFLLWKSASNGHDFFVQSGGKFEWQQILASDAPYVLGIFMAVYFFRVLLFQFNSTQAQLLQLEIRMAAFAFIEEYAKFVKNNKGVDLGKFESLVFGGIVAELDKVPSTFDGFEPLAKAFNGLRRKGEE